MLPRIPIYSALARYTLKTAADVLPSLLWRSLIFLQSCTERRKRQKTTTSCYMILMFCSLALPLSPFLCVCVSDGIHVPDLFRRVGNAGDTKALRHILLARTLFKKNRHTCSLQAHTYPYTHIHMQVQAHMILCVA